eukprot:271336_1
MATKSALTKTKAHIDHLIYVSHDLNQAINTFSNILGVTPTIGGRHLKWGTYNALFSLNNAYFEILAPDPQSDIRPTKFFCDTQNEGLITWVTQIPSKYSNCMQQFKEYMLPYDIGNIIDCERLMADNDSKLLQWTLCWPTDDNLIFKQTNGILPIMIDWSKCDKSIQPINTTPTGCELLGLNCYYSCENEYEYKQLHNIFYDKLDMENIFNLRSSNNQYEIGMECIIGSPNGTIRIETFRDVRNNKVVVNDIRNLSCNL